MNGGKIMGTVVGLIRVMPSDVLKDDQLTRIMDEIKTLIKPPAKLGNIEIKNIAFGLRGLNVTVTIPDTAGGIDPIAEEISKLENVETAEVTDVGLL
jgi:translation elongation factor aEF-1 beta